MSGHLLELENITLSFGEEPVLEGVSFALDRGDCAAIIGPNGSGKTILLRALSGLMLPVEGKIMLSGTDITRYPPWKRTRMGLVHVLEGARLFPSLTVEENLFVSVNNKKSRIFENIDRLKSLVPFLTDPHFLKRSAATLSGGERMMVAIARAALQNPKIMLLDSPFMGSGPNFRMHAIKIINILLAEQKIGIILVDHDIPSTRKVSQSILSIKNRKIT